MALLAGFYLTSCKDHDNGYETVYDEKTQTFEKVFENLYGKPDPNHDWGFGSSNSIATTRIAGTRADNDKPRANTNANEWADVSNSTGFGGWMVPDPLTEGQIKRVKAYFQNNPNLTYKDPKWNNFFVQQVYKGNTKDQVGNNSPEVVTAANGSKYDSNNMNLMTVGRNALHINNFNSGDASKANVLDNGANIATHTGETYHEDKIMLMVDIDDTSCFGYHETGSSNEQNDPSGQHNDRAALVSALVIDTWAESAEAKALGIDLGSSVIDKWNRSFLGFDLAIKEGNQIWSGKTQKLNSGLNMGYDGLYYADDNIVNFENGNMPNGMSDVMKDAQGNPLKILIANTNFYSGVLKKINDSDLRKDLNGKVYLNMAYVNENLISKGYYPVDGSAFKDWIKPEHSYDGYFSDWIVTLTKATRVSNAPTTPTVTPDTPNGDEVTTTSTGTEHKLLRIGRVLVEDLYRASNEDIDFNDAVFDAAIWKVTTNGNITVEGDTKTFTPTNRSVVTYEVELYLLAAGGTIPLNIASDATEPVGEVHQVFKAANLNEPITGVCMVNTVGAGSDAYGSYVNGIAPVHKKFDYTSKLSQKPDDDHIYLNDIKVDVLWTIDGQTVPYTLNNKELVTYAKDAEGNYIREDGKLVEISTDEATAPHMICVPLGTQWPTERQNIQNGYPKFAQYVQNRSKRDEFLASKIEGSRALYEGYTNTTFKLSNYVGMESLTEGKSYYTNVQEVPVSGPETIIWRNDSGVFYDGWKGPWDYNLDLTNVSGSKTKLRVYLTRETNSDTGNSKVEVNHKDWAGLLFSQHNQIPNDVQYVEMDIQESDITTMRNKGAIWIAGQNIRVTRIVLM